MTPIPYAKDHDGWNAKKKQIDSRAVPLYFHPREIWYCCIGHNIGDEEDGKNSDYSRPVVIIKRFGPNLFIGIPLTTKIKQVPYYFGIGNVNGKAAMAIVTQLRLFSAKRLINKVDTLSEPVFKALKKAAKNSIF